MAAVINVACVQAVLAIVLIHPASVIARASVIVRSFSNIQFVCCRQHRRLICVTVGSGSVH